MPVAGSQAPIIETIVTQHAEEAAFAWLLRDAAVAAPHYDLDDLAELDERVEAHLDGLRIAGDPGWTICADQLQYQESGEVFAAGVLALESRDAGRLRQVYSVVDSVPETARGLITAFGWCSPQKLQGTVKELLESNLAFWQRIGLAACCAHRVDPGRRLAEWLDHEDDTLRARSLRAVGELGRSDLAARLNEHLRSDHEASRFWAAWSGVLLGDRGRALEMLSALAASDNPFQADALQLALRASAKADAQTVLKALAQGSEGLRAVVVGAGITGDPWYVPWLIEQMETPALARVAGESFTLITGADLAELDLEGEWPEGFTAGPTESPEDEEVSMDPDEDLPWPEPERVRTWWDANQGRFDAGTRYLLGQPVSGAHCGHVLRAGWQRQRRAAALELALLRPGAPLFETRAPGFQQRHRLQTEPALA